MKRSVSLIILVAGTLLASCSSLQTISFDQLQAADVSFPDAVRKVAVINNMPVLKTKDNHEILSSELEGDGKVASEALAENIANVNYFDQVIICDSVFRAQDKVPRVNVILTNDELPPLGLSKILFLMLEIGVLLYYYIQIKVKQIDAGVLKRHIGLINSIIILNLFILINIHQLELSNRLFTYSAVLSVFPLCYLVQKYRLKENVITLFFVIMQLLLVLYFMNSIYIYEIPFGILINPFHLLFQ